MSALAAVRAVVVAVIHMRESGSFDLGELHGYQHIEARLWTSMGYLIQ
jgi:hypothetical protein